MQVPDPPSSYDRGAYSKVHPHSSSNGTVSGIVGASAPLASIGEVESTSTQNDSAARIVPDSQSQGQVLEESTFRGFSPTQPQQVDDESNGVDVVEPQLENPSSSTEAASQPPPSVVPEPHHDSNEVQASGGAERSESPEEDQTRAAHTYNTSATVQSVTEQTPSNPAPTQHSAQSNGSRRSIANSPQASNDVTAAFSEVVSEKQAIVEASPEKAQSWTTSEFRSQDQTTSAVQEAQLEEPHIDSQKHSPVTVSSQQPLQPLQLDDYIVISAEEDPPSTLGLLTQPDFNPPPAGQRPPPSSLISEVVPPATSAIKKDAHLQSAAPLFGSSQSSFPFATQQPFPTKVENESRPRAVFTPRIASPRSSSQIASVPSHSIITIGESAPARLVTPSPNSTAPANMESDGSTSGNPLLTQLNAVIESGKARRRARRSNTPAAAALHTPHAASAIPPSITAELVASQARQSNGGRSPSTVPALEPEPHVTKEEMRTSGRLPTLVSLAHGENSGDHHETLTVSESSRAVHDDPEQANVHIIPIAFGNIQRDQYKNGFQWYQGEIQGFLDGDDSPERFSKAKAALDELRHIAIHPDLINSEAFSQPLSTPEQAQWDVDASCKFRFLRDLLEELRTQDRKVHVLVAAKGQIIPEMLDNFLQATEVPHARLITEAQPASTSGLFVSILDLDAEVSIEHIERADIVVAMDGTCHSKDPLVQSARRAGRDKVLAALLVLVAPCTVEHIERSLLPSMADTTRVRTLLKNALKLQLQGVAGRLAPGQAPSREAAGVIASSIANSTEWPIEELGTIDNLDSQTETDIDATVNGGSSNAGKRSLEDDIDTLTGNISKRPRGSSVEVEGQVEGTFPATINPQDIEITHISDSIGKATQSALDDLGSSSEVEQLRHILSQKQDELQEHVKAMSDLQFRHEDQHVELAKTKTERDEAIITAQNAVTRMSLAANQSAELRTERTELKEQLAEANSKLLNHVVPERREFETLRLAMEQEKLAKEKAEKRSEQAQKDSEYSRELYQNTSSQARELAQQNADLEARLIHAEELAAGEQAKAQEATANGRDKLLDKENKKLKALLRDREASMKFKDEEITRLKEAGRGRMGTRGSSVPRSPRMGSPALKGRNSRQTSPATGEVRGKHLHPLRNG